MPLELFLALAVPPANVKCESSPPQLRTRTSREATAAGKGKVDALHLQLQNLLYEVLHLQKEVRCWTDPLTLTCIIIIKSILQVTKCQQFKSKDEEVDLIPVEEFYALAPEEISKRETTTKGWTTGQTL